MKTFIPKAEKPIDIGEVITSIGNETFSKCPHCDFVGSKSDIEGHIAKKHGFVVICGECGNKFPDPKTCEDHIETFHRINIEEHEEVSCRKCAYKSKDINLIDIHMEEYHGGKKIVVEESKDIVVELTCRGCNYEGKSCDDIRQHKSKHVLLKCDQCDYIAGRNDELKQHKQTQHSTARVNLQNTLPTNKKSIIISCDQYDYSCKLRIQLRHHIIRAHQSRKDEEKKYTCTSCSFQTDFLIKIYEHKLATHPEVSMEFNPKTTSVKDMAINLIAEQNIEMMEEVLALKKGIIESFAQLSEESQSRHEALEKEYKQKEEFMRKVFESFTIKLNNLQNAHVCTNVPREEVCPPPSAKQSTTPPPQPTSKESSSLPSPKPATSKKKRSHYLQKKKVLFVGDCVAHNVNFARVEQDTNTRLRTIKAYSSTEDLKARWPHKNVTDVTPAALENTKDNDKYTELVLGAPTDDISNLNVSKLAPNDNVEVYKQIIVVSCHNMLSVAENAIRRHPELIKVVLLKHSPRHDETLSDPTGLKPKLAKFANSTLAQMCQNSDLKDKIVVGKHNLDCGDDQIAAVFKDDRSGRYDGVHMYGRLGKQLYTKSVSEIINSVIPSN